MTKNLRRKHLYAWLLLAVLLPSAIVIARISVQKPVIQISTESAISSSFPAVKTWERKDYTIVLHADENYNTVQLEWIKKSKGFFPAVNLYLASAGGNNIERGLLVGSVGDKNSYLFSLDTAMLNNLPDHKILLHDFVRNHIIDSLNFKP
jgi:hypothetical protein